VSDTIEYGMGMMGITESWRHNPALRGLYWRLRSMAVEAVLRICFRRKSRNRAEHIRGLETKCARQAEEITEMRLQAEFRNSERRALNILVACDGPCNRAYMDDPSSVDEDVVRIAVYSTLRLLHWWRRGGQGGADAYLKRVRDDVRRTKTRKACFFALECDPAADAYGKFYVATQSFWNANGHLDDSHITKEACLPNGFNEVMESVFEFDGPPDKGKDALLAAGLTENKSMLP